MIDLLELRSTLAEALGGAIGTYTFVGTGATTPAIRVDDGSNPYEEEPKVDGLEVVIAASPEVPIAMLMGGYQQTFTVAIVLKQWDINATALDAMERVLPALMQSDSLAIGNPRRIVRSTRLDNIETLTIPVSQTFLSQTFLD